MKKLWIIPISKGVDYSNKHNNFIILHNTHIRPLAINYRLSETKIFNPIDNHYHYI